MKNIIKTLYIILFFSSFYACTKSRDIHFPYETTVFVVDMKGNPLSGRTVRAIGATYDTITKTTGITDANGKAVLKYSLFLPSTSSPESAAIAVNDDVLLRGINSGTHTVDGHSSTFTCRIEMDSFVAIKVRLQRTDTSLIDLDFSGGWIETRNQYYLSQNFVNWMPKNIRTIDSTLTFLSWQNTPFTLWTTVTKKTDLSFKILRFVVNPQNFRDSAMLIRL
jgi:hypothetical protein